MLICEELFLLLTKDSGRPASWTHEGVAQGLRAAAVADLLAHERVALEVSTQPAKERGSPRVRVTDPTPTGHPVLDQALENLVTAGDRRTPHRRHTAKDTGEDTTTPRDHDRGRLVFSLLFEDGLNLCPAVARSLASVGTVELSTGGLLGRQTVYRVLDPAPREALRQRLSSVLRGHTEPTQADRVLLAALRLVSAERKALPQQDTGLTSSERRQRVTEVIGEDPLSSYVSRADTDPDGSGDDWWLFFVLFFPIFATTFLNFLNR